MESRESCLAADGRAWKVDGRAQALVGPGLATPLDIKQFGASSKNCVGTPVVWQSIIFFYASSLRAFH